ncbi:MAG: nucleotide exchange factor GrpE [Thermodesulfobacteriota bacterium]|nr:nucleotide exchange factor GrpE [Thermodesulfobacteriota bacterium]
MTENNNLDTKENAKDEENKLFFKSFSDFKDFIESSKYSIRSISENEIIFKFDDKDQTTNFFTMVIDEDVEAFLKLKDNLESAKKELNEKLLRLAAEFENYKKRNLIEKKQATYIAKENMLRDLLFFIDNFERGLNLYENTQKDTDFFKGMKSVEKDFKTFLEKNNIKKININIGDDFNPNFHQALELKKSDKFDSNKILEVIQTGYSLDDKLLRPSLVIVSSGADNE